MNIPNHKRAQQLDQIMKITGSALWTWDIASGEMHFDPLFFTMAGYEIDEFPHQAAEWEKRIHPEDRERVMELANNHLKGLVDCLDAEFRFRRKDNTYMWIRSRGEIVEREENGKPLKMLGRHSDITERKQTLDNLETERTYFEHLFQGVPAGVVLLDKEDRVLELNEGFTQLFQYTIEEARGQTINQLIVPEELKNEGHDATQKVAEKKTIYLETVRKRKDGVHLHVTISGKPLKREKGEVAVIGVYQDITKRVEAETELIKAREEAQAANQAKSEFLANMSHEIRTPLHCITGFTELLTGTPLTQLQQDYLQNVNASAQLLMELINDVLDLAKIEAGKLELMEEYSDIHTLSRQALDIIKYRAEKKGLRISTAFEPDIPRYAKVDALRLKQVLVNLLGNAAKFTQKGSITLEMGFESTGGNTGVFSYSVHDTGSGIHPDDQVRLFEAFYQAGDARSVEGSGLGLQISAMLVDKMNGKMHLESTPGKGSTFGFSFPARFRSGPALPSNNIIKKEIPPDFASASHTAKPTILLVEDVEINIELLKSILGQLLPQATLLEARNGQQALDLLDQGHRPDLILMDMQMPVMDGLEATRTIRSRGKHSHIPIMALTAGVVKGEREKCMEAGMDAFLAKPFNVKLLREALEQFPGIFQPHHTESPEKATGKTTHFNKEGTMDRLQLDESTVLMLAKKSLEEILRMVPDLSDQLNAGHWQAAESTLHKIKGMAANLGFSALSKLAQKMEMITANNPTHSQELLGQMRDEANILEEILLPKQ